MKHAGEKTKKTPHIYSRTSKRKLKTKNQNWNIL